MARLTWNEPEDRIFETGIDRGVLYVDGEPAVPWNGLTTVVERPSGGQARPYYIDGVKYLNLASLEEFAGTIEAFCSPPEFDICDGAAVVVQGIHAYQQVRKSFGFSFRSIVGNAVEGVEHGYKIHIIYNALASPTTRSYVTNGESEDPLTLSWNLSAKPVEVFGYFPTAHITIDTKLAGPWKTHEVERLLYGNDDDWPSLPSPSPLMSLFSVDEWVFVVDNGDGTFDLHTSGDQLVMDDVFNFSITSPHAIDLGDETFTLSTSPWEIGAI